MSTEETEPVTPREGRGGTLTDVARAVDTLVVVTREGMRRAMLMILGCAVLLAVSTFAMLLTYLRVHAQTERLETLAFRLEALAEEQAKTRDAAEKTQARVDEQAAAEEQKPTVEIKPTPPKAGKPQGAVVVIKPAKPKPPIDHADVAPTPTIEIPIKLPEAATTQAPLDGGPGKK